MKADFHVHTTNSDCSDDPRTVFMKAKEAGVTHLAITDHDTLVGIEENQKLAEEFGITYIPAIEISAYDYSRDSKCHIIGLYVRKGYKPLDNMIAYITKQRQLNSSKQVQKLMDMGYDIDFSDFDAIKGYNGIYKQHIMDVLMKKGYVDAFFGDFYDRMFKGQGPLNLTIDYPSHIDATKALAESGAIPILAHPTLYDNLPAVKELVAAGLKGIEVSYPSVDNEDVPAILSTAQDYNLALSGGSDYHGRYAGHSEGSIGTHYLAHFEFLRDDYFAK